MFRSWRLFGNSIIDVFLPEPFLTDSLGKCVPFNVLIFRIL